MDFRALVVLISFALALFARANAKSIAARNPSLAELREHLQNTTDYKCWCAECKSTNATHLNYYALMACEQLMEDMILKLDNEHEFYYGDILQSILDLMFDNLGFCGDTSTPISSRKNNSGFERSNSWVPGRTITFTDQLTSESCMHPDFAGWKQPHKEGNQLSWIKPGISLVLIVNVIGGIYLHYRLKKVESYNQRMERQEEERMLLDPLNNVENV